jgi:CBS domain containing-hemolysin-like protein
MHGLSLLEFVAVAMLILVNGFFVAAEFAIVSIRATRIEQLLAAGIPGARAVRRLQQDMDDFLPAVQLGVTFCSLALGWLGEPLAFSLLRPWISVLPHARLYADLVAFIVGFALITYFQVVIGELVPKSLALRRPEALASAIAPPMLVFMALVRPAVRLLRASAAAVLSGFDAPLTDRAQVHSADELKLIATAARRMGILPEFQERIVHRALELDDVPVREIMTPRQKIFSLPSNMTLDEAQSRIVAHHHSRVPVYDEARGPEHIIGVVYSRDLARLSYAHAHPQQSVAAPAGDSFRPGAPEPALSLHWGTAFESWARRAAAAALPATAGERKLADIMHEALVVPESKSVLDLIRDFLERRRHLAIAVDEYGSVAGLVTVEDAIEQLVGELEDEFDVPAQPVLSTAPGAFLMEGSVNLRDLETQMQWDLPREGGVETLAGFVLYRLGHIPAPGESVVFEDRRLTVVEMDARRIARILVEPAEPGGASKASGAPRTQSKEG